MQMITCTVKICQCHTIKRAGLETVAYIATNHPDTFVATFTDSAFAGRIVEDLADESVFTHPHGFAHADLIFKLRRFRRPLYHSI